MFSGISSVGQDKNLEGVLTICIRLDKVPDTSAKDPWTIDEPCPEWNLEGIISCFIPKAHCPKIPCVLSCMGKSVWKELALHVHVTTAYVSKAPGSWMHLDGGCTAWLSESLGIYIITYTQLLISAMLRGWTLSGCLRTARNTAHPRICRRVGIQFGPAPMAALPRTRYVGIGNLPRQFMHKSWKYLALKGSIYGYSGAKTSASTLWALRAAVEGYTWCLGLEAVSETWRLFGIVRALSTVVGSHIDNPNLPNALIEGSSLHQRYIYTCRGIDSNYD